MELGIIDHFAAFRPVRPARLDSRRGLCGAARGGEAEGEKIEIRPPGRASAASCRVVRFRAVRVRADRWIWAGFCASGRCWLVFVFVSVFLFVC